MATTEKEHRTSGEASSRPTRPSARVAQKTAGWRLTGFGPASEEPYRRRVTDWFWLLFDGAVLVLGAGLVWFVLMDARRRRTAGP